MVNPSQDKDSAILKATNKVQRAARRKAAQDAETQSLIEQAKVPRRAKVAAMDKDWDKIINQRAVRSAKRNGESGLENMMRKKARLSDDADNGKGAPARHVQASSRNSRVPPKHRKIVTDSEDPTASDSDQCSDGSKSSPASEDDEQLSDDDLAKRVPGMSEKDYTDMYNMEKVKIVRAGDLFNSDEHVVSARSSSGLSRDLSDGNDAEQVPDPLPQAHSKFSKREEVFTQERARIVVTKESGPRKSKPQRRRSNAPKIPRKLSFTSADDDCEGPPIKNKDRLANDAELQWPRRIQVFYNDGIKLRQQNPIIKTIVAEAIQRCEVHMISINAFPETGQREEFRYEMARQAIKTLYRASGEDTGYHDAYNRAREDKNFVHKLGEVAVDRLAHYRSEIRAAAWTHLAVYQLGIGQVCQQRVTALLKGNLFVYEGHWGLDETGNDAWVIKKRSAYLSPAIVETIRAAWFTSERTLGNQHQALYTSSLPAYPDEKELPIPLVALAATGVHAALSNWRMGTSRLKIQRFTRELVASTYKTFSTSLENFKNERPSEFHFVMSMLYTAVCGTRSDIDATGMGDDPLAVFDLDIDLHL